MSTAGPATITFIEPDYRRGSLTGVPDVDHPDSEHRQDWTTTTPVTESWAYKERRRSAGWHKTDLPASPKKTIVERRGSILSVWTPGKDKTGKDILIHGDGDDEVVIIDEPPKEEEEVKPRAYSRSSDGYSGDRRGSILSMWTMGKDEHGRDVVMHDDEEWKS